MKISTGTMTAGMMRHAGAIALVVAFAIFLGEKAHAQSAEHLDVVELFTSQACSACPPADKLLAELADSEGLLALSFSVDYWNYLEWEDTLADPAFTTRQRAYAKARGDRDVYTPQVVVNGAIHAVGSDAKALQAALTQTRQSDREHKVALSLRRLNDSSLIVEAGPAPEGMETPEATLWLVVYADSQTIKIDAGENEGRTLTYRNVVRELVPLGQWRGERLRQTVAVPDVPGRRCAVLLQQGNSDSPGAILAATRLQKRK